MSETFEDEKYVSHRIKFSILLTLEIPALLLSLLIFFYSIQHRTMMQALHNRALLILLVVNFIQLLFILPLNIHFYALGRLSPALPVFCTWWTFFAYSLYVSSEYLMAAISIQRHVLVFNGHVLRVRWKCIVFHHLPLMFCLTYPMIFYVFAILLDSCDGTQWDYTSDTCGFANCYLLFNKILGTFDWSVNNGLPMVVNALANVLLVVRVIQQKRRQNRPVTWRQQRRMTIQLFCVSSLYLIAWSPSLIVGMVQIISDPMFLAAIQVDYLLELTNAVCLFLPWICLGLFPEVIIWIKTLLHCNPPRNAVRTVMNTQLPTRMLINQANTASLK